MLTKPILVATAVLTTPAAAVQTTWIVDDDGGAGVDFTEIQAAVDAASAGDLIDVLPGNYRRFTLKKPIAILGPVVGTEIATVWGITSVQRIPSGSIATISGLECDEVDALNCEGTVLLDAISTETVRVEFCSDVRLQGVRMQRGSVTGLRVAYSRVSVHDTVINAGPPNPDDRGALAIDGDATVVLSRTSLLGRPGFGPGPFGGGGGQPGGPAVQLYSAGSEELHFLNCSILGGDGMGSGNGPQIAGCSSVTTVYTTSTQLSNCPTVPIDVPDRPLLEFIGDSTAGASSSLRITGTPTSNVRVALGKTLPVPPAMSGIPMLNTIDRGLLVGAIDSTGFVSTSVVVPNVARGTALLFQASAVPMSGTALFSHPLAVVVR